MPTINSIRSRFARQSTQVHFDLAAIRPALRADIERANTAIQQRWNVLPESTAAEIERREKIRDGLYRLMDDADRVLGQIKQPSPGGPGAASRSGGMCSGAGDAQNGAAVASGEAGAGDWLAAWRGKLTAYQREAERVIEGTSKFYG